MAKTLTSSYVLTLKLNTDTSDEMFINKRLFLSCKVYNQLVSYVRKQLKKLYSDYRYRNCLKLLSNIKDKADKDSKALRSKTGKKMNSIRMEYGLSEYQLHNYVSVLQHKYKNYLGSQTCQKIASDAWRAVEKYLFSNGKIIHYKKYENTHLLHGAKTNQTYIAFDISSRCVRIGKCQIPVKIDYNDLYVVYALQDKIKYCQIIRKPFSNGYHYYLQLVLEGIPPKKHVISDGRIGIDIGTSTVAVCSKEKVILKELGKNTTDYSKQIKCIQRAIERSRRINNPNKYNSDGTINIHNYDKWNNSKTYKKLIIKKKALERKQAESLKYSHNHLANEIIEIGNEVYVEHMTFSGLQKRKKETTKSKNGKFHRKGRFGKSIKNHAPAMLISIIGRKLKYQNLEIHKVNTKTFRASQYNHVTDEYIKKKLNNRSFKINDIKIQRDLYSAFLLMNSESTLNQTNRELCIETFNQFIKNHNQAISELTKQYNQGIKFPTCMGIKSFL